MLTIFFRNGKVDHYHESVCDNQHLNLQYVKVVSCFLVNLWPYWYWMVNATIAIIQPLNLSIKTAFISPSKSYMINTILLNVGKFLSFWKILLTTLIRHYLTRDVLPSESNYRNLLSFSRHSAHKRPTMQELRDEEIMMNNQEVGVLNWIRNRNCIFPLTSK